MTLQQQVQQHLQNTGISLRELSRRSGVSHTTIGKILRGGTYKSDTANDLIFAMSFYGGDTARPVMQDKAVETLDAAVEQLAAQRVNADLTHHADWDVDLQCAKYRRVMALEKELNDEKRNFAALEQAHEHVAGSLKSCENALIEAHETITKQEQQLNDANTAYLSSKSQHERDLQRLSDANAEIKRLTALSETHGQSWKAACVQVEQLQKQLDHGQAQFASLHEAYNQQIDDEAEMLAQIDKLLAERETTATLHDQQVMRLRVYAWSLIAALVFMLVSGLVVWGGV